MSSRKDLRIKAQRSVRRKRVIRRRIFGSAEVPRLTVFRSLKNIDCQLIDDRTGRTVASATTRSKEFRDGWEGKSANCDAAKRVGQLIAARARDAGVTRVQFDRNGYKFHGRVKALADAAREAGLKF